MKPVYLLIALLFSTACGNQSSSEAEVAVGKAAYAPEKNPVDTIVLRRQVFQKQCLLRAIYGYSFSTQGVAIALPCAMIGCHFVAKIHLGIKFKQLLNL